MLMMAGVADDYLQLIFLFRSLLLTNASFVVLIRLFHILAADPLYWVAHGAVERLFQFTIFNDWLSDYEYDTDSECTGHMKDGVKAWLKGYYFNDETIAAETLTNEDLIAILHPQKSQYRDLLNFVYDVSDYSWCNTKEWYD
jgi:hypothetical protein